MIGAAKNRSTSFYRNITIDYPELLKIALDLILFNYASIMPFLLSISASFAQPVGTILVL
ncbi:hypothetical protein AKG12_12370 [Agrobacterium sp. SUL3]|nr:hypothetical protein AKG12_12370 [Agrobacterium sp. SUL3]